MPRFFIENLPDGLNRIELIGENFHHIKNVLRMKVGEKLTISSAKGYDYLVELLEFEIDKVQANVIKRVENTTESHLEITLFQGVPKSDKMELIIQKSVELGVHKIIPFISRRTIVKFDSEKDKIKKTERWQKIANEACKQAHRGKLVEVLPPIDFKLAIKQAKECELKFVCYEKEDNRGIKTYIKDSKTQKIAIFIGPEGGFSEEEINLCENSEIIPITLGPRILRTETAGLTVISILMYELGDIG